MSGADEDLIFVSFRKVVCDLYFAGWKEGRDCAGCQNVNDCYRMIREAMQYAKTHKHRFAELQEVRQVN